MVFIYECDAFRGHVSGIVEGSNFNDAAKKISSLHIGMDNLQMTVIGEDTSSGVTIYPINFITFLKEEFNKIKNKDESTEISW